MARVTRRVAFSMRVNVTVVAGTDYGHIEDQTPTASEDIKPVSRADDEPLENGH